MASLYLHIPFCQKACHYCNFHFSTQLKLKAEFIKALILELKYRANEFENTVVESIYFGGGTPSLLSKQELELLLNTIYQNYRISTSPEITLEANPDDLTSEKLTELADSSINRLSIGIQSFFEEDLLLMNRSHHALQAMDCLIKSKELFKNISVDLIYGIPSMNKEKWTNNLKTFFDFKLPHLSAYALTIEPKTVFQHQVNTNQIKLLEDAQYLEHYQLLLELTEAYGYDNYEFSNFGKEPYFSKQNTAYWTGKKYLGFGPSAHSYDGKNRSWNIANNSKYIHSWLHHHKPLFEKETLSISDKFNEYIMVSLRTKWGVSTEEIVSKFGENLLTHFNKEKTKLELENKLSLQENRYIIPKNMKFLTDGIASDLFYLK